jgi:hypothetical protein
LLREQFSGEASLKLREAKERTGAINSLFAIVVMSILGWAFLEASILRYKFGLGAHLSAAVPALALAGLALYRYRLHWPASGQGVKGPLATIGTVLSGVLLLGAGVATALLLSRGLMVLLAPIGLGAVFVPWTKIRICREQFAVSVAAVVVGAIAGLAIFRRPLDPFSPLLTTLLLWMTATGAQWRVLHAFGNDKERMPPSGYRAQPPGDVGTVQGGDAHAA